MGTGPKDRIAVMTSGGVDSAVLLRWAAQRYKEIYPVYVRCGLRWEKAELHWLGHLLRAMPKGPGRPRRRLQPLAILDVSVGDLYAKHWSMAGKRGVPGMRSADQAVFLPGRNVLLLGKVSVYCYLHGIGNIALASLAANPFRDSSPRFLRQSQKAFHAAYGVPIRVHAPFLRKKKPAILRMAKGLPLDLTFSCLAPRGNRPCGNCNKCAEWKKALVRKAR